MTTDDSGAMSTPSPRARPPRGSAAATATEAAEPHAGTLPGAAAALEPDGLATASSKRWFLETGGGAMAPRSAVDVLVDMNDRVQSGQLGEYEPIPLGLAPIDRTIGGGIKPGELLLIGGAQGTGKTTMALQMARNVAASGQAFVLYVCFEHDEADLLNRLIAMESVLPHLPHKAGAVRVQEVRRELLGGSLSQVGSGEGDGSVAPRPDLADNARLRPALQRVARYGQNLYFMRGSATSSTVDNLRELVRLHRDHNPDQRLLVVVDYLQKVPQVPEPTSEAEKVTYVVNGLKDIALTERVPVISIVAADKEGLKASRLRNYHLRGSSAINYEADIILILNEKYQIVAKVNIEFNPYQAQRFRDWVILTVEKNRSGLDNIDLEYEKLFEFSCFDPNGRPVQEKLIEERLYND
jgi:replicative DNA helicase